MNTLAASGLSRRRFLAAATSVSAPLILPAAVLGRDGSVAPSERIVAGCIGMGSRGSGHANEIAAFPDTQVVATCDVFRSRAEEVRLRLDARYADLQGAGGYQGCTAYQDFRELLARPDIDAITIASPENWHAVMAIEAMKAGKDVYCEKALSLTVAEGRAVCEAARRFGRVFQAGTQQRSDPRFRFACELARNGYLGTVKKVWVGVPGGRSLPVLPEKPVPEDLDYDLWLGPAQFKPYRDGLCSYNWYFVSDYCAGWIQSWGVHHVDIALWGLPALAAATCRWKAPPPFRTKARRLLLRLAHHPEHAGRRHPGFLRRPQRQVVMAAGSRATKAGSMSCVAASKRSRRRCSRW